MSRRRIASAGTAAALAALMLSACGSSGTTNSASAAGGSSNPGKKWDITYIQGVTGNPFYTSVGCGAQSVAAKYNVNLTIQGPQTYDPSQQIPIVDSVVASHPDALMIAEDDAKALIPPLLRAKNAGVKVLMVDGELGDPSIPIFNGGSDNEAGGQLAGQNMAKMLGGKGTVLAVTNNPTSIVSSARIKGFADEIAKHPDMKYLGVQYSQNQTVNAANILTSTLSAHPDLAGVFTATTNNTEGVATGITSSGKSGQIKLIGFDTSDPIVKDIKSGVVTADVVQAPYKLGQIEVENAVKALQGQQIPRTVHTPFVLATQQNIDTPDVQQYIYKVHC